jgi:hypothetical protein
MRIRFNFAQPYDPFLMVTVANAFVDLQQLWPYIVFIADDDPVDQHPFDEHLYQFLLADSSRQRFELIFRNAFLDPSPSIYGVSLFAVRISYQSPLEVEATATRPSRLPRVRAVLDVLSKILTIDLLREKLRIETEIQRQRAIEAALKNYERTLAVSKKIKNVEEREVFTRNFARAISYLSSNDSQLISIELVEDAREHIDAK